MDNIVKFAASKGYSVSKDGTVFNKSGNQVKGSLKNGYRVFNIRTDGGIRSVPVHRLQAFFRYGDAMFENGVVVRHLNGVKEDNSFDNIAIGSASDNMMDVPQPVRLAKALRASSFLRKHDKGLIQEYYKESKSYKKTMERFGITSKGTLHFILNT